MNRNRVEWSCQVASVGSGSRQTSPQRRGLHRESGDFLFLARNQVVTPCLSPGSVERPAFCDERTAGWPADPAALQSPPPAPEPPQLSWSYVGADSDSAAGAEPVT